jgi:hypothetical protein
MRARSAETDQHHQSPMPPADREPLEAYLRLYEYLDP